MISFLSMIPAVPHKFFYWLGSSYDPCSSIFSHRIPHFIHNSPRSGVLEVEDANTEIQVPLIHQRSIPRAKGVKEAGRVREGNWATNLTRSLASAWSHRELWTVNCTSALAPLEARGQESHAYTPSRRAAPAQLGALLWGRGELHAFTADLDNL